MTNPLRILQLDLDLSKRVLGLDLMRAVAILIVVLGHGDVLVRSHFPDFVNFWVMDGVDLFFVLSGFLIGTILIKTFEQHGFNRKTIVLFWKRRWFRTLPNYYLILVVTLVYSYFTVHSFSGFSWKYLLFLQSFNSAHPDFLGIAWSLAIEEWFYLLFPLVAYGIYRVRPLFGLKRVFLISIVLFLLLPLVYRVLRGFSVGFDSDVVVWDDLVRKPVTTRMDTIVFGVAGAYVRHYHFKIWHSCRHVAFGLGLLFIYVAQRDLSPSPYLYTLFFDAVALGALLLLPLLATVRQGPSWLALPVTYLSVISYSMYLIHFSLILNAAVYRNIYLTSPVAGASIYALYLSVTVVLSILLYKYFEHPVLNLRDKPWSWFVAKGRLLREKAWSGA